MPAKNVKRAAEVGVPFTIGVRMAAQTQRRDVALALQALERAGFHAGPTSGGSLIAMASQELRSQALDHGEEYAELADRLDDVARELWS